MVVLVIVEVKDTVWANDVTHVGYFSNIKYVLTPKPPNKAKLTEIIATNIEMLNFFIL